MKKTYRTVLMSLLLAFGWQVGTWGQAPSIQEGNILHCFDWKYTDIQAELDNILAAGFTAVQTSPAQSNYTGVTSWNTLYRPRDTEIGPNTLGTKEQLKALCEAAHARGLKVIVDIVANHTDGSLQWVADYWKNTDLYHTLGWVSNWNDRWQVTHGEIGMKDLKTEDQRVYSKFKTYIQELKSIGVDGCRWDAAKHIGLPSEGDQFWAQALDKSMYNYGEILDNTGGDDGRLLPEYMQYMSVTDSPYGTNNVLGSARNGQASPYGNGNYAPRFNTNKVVYWGESHDTYCNDGGASDGVSQAVVDRAYAVAASHNQIPALYFSRPSGRGSQAQAGVKGSTHFTSKCVAEVNKFHNAMNGKAEYYTANGSVASITRKGGGAIVVNFGGSGQVTIANGGSYATPGTYTDQVSGNQWTITASTISGQTDNTGIAVLYNAVPDDKAQVTLSPMTGTSFKTETLTVTATANDKTASAWYQVGTGSKTSFTGTASFEIGQGMAVGSEIVVKWGAKNDKGEESTGSARYIKKDPAAKGITVKVTSTGNAPSLYVWTATDTKVNGAWPGSQMTDSDGDGVYEANFDLETLNFIINDGQSGGAQSGDITGVTSDVWYDWNGSSATVHSGGQAPAATTSFPTDGVYVFYNNPNNWSTVNLYVYNDKGDYAKWPGSAMTFDSTVSGFGKDGWYKFRLPAGYETAKVIVNNGGSAQYPGTGQPGIDVKGASVFLNGTSVITGIGKTTVSGRTADSAWYTLSGTRLSEKPSQRGIYIHDGKKYIVR